MSHRFETRKNPVRDKYNRQYVSVIWDDAPEARIDGGPRMVAKGYGCSPDRARAAANKHLLAGGFYPNGYGAQQ